MKLLIVLSVIACGYADKLDRAYLPPVNAAIAGGSPGALIAPGLTDSRAPGSTSGQTGPAIGQGLPSGRQPGLGQLRPSYGSGSAQNGPGFGTGINLGQGGVNQGSGGFNQFPSGPGSNALTPGGNTPFGASQTTFGTTPVAGTFNVGAQPIYRPQSGGSPSQGFGQGPQGFNVPQAQAYKPERPQAAADKNAEILKYVNENDGESYLYSYETSNGISAEESGIATNGVKAQGGFSYTGDDGQAYSVTYTADENGFQPQGDHLPTPHPIPEEILKSIEENARAAASGTQEGAYRPEEYESEGSPQQYNIGQTSFNRPQGQIQGSNQGSFSQRPATQAQSNQFSVNQGTFRPSDQSGQIGQTRPSQGSYQFASGVNGPQSQYQKGPVSQFGQSSQTGQIKPTQGSSQFTTGQASSQGPSAQYPSGPGRNQGTFGQSSGQGSIGQGLGQTSQIQSSSGYNYNQPQNGFGSATQFGSGVQNRPQSNEGPNTFGYQNGQGSYGLQTGKVPSSETPFGTSQSGLSYSQKVNRPGNNPTGSVNILGQGQNQLNGNKPFGSSQGSQVRPGNEGSPGPARSGSSGYQYSANANRPSFGDRPNGVSSQSSPGSIANQPFGANSGIKGSTTFGPGNAESNVQIGQGQQNGNRPLGGNIGINQESSPFGISSAKQKTGPGSVFSKGNKPSFGSNVGPSQGSAQFVLGSQQSTSAQDPSASKGSLPVQAPYQYNRPSQSFPTQQRPGSSGFSSIDRPSSGSQGVNGQRPGFNAFGPQTGNEGPGSSSLGNQGINEKRPTVGSFGSQGGNGRPDGTSGSQGGIGQTPGFTRSQGVNGRPASTGTQAVNGQHPDGTISGSQGLNVQRPVSSGPSGPGQGNQGRPEQFGGPRQPPSFSAEEGYKY